MEDEYETSGLRGRLKKSSMKISCCFNGNHQRLDDADSGELSPPSPSPSSPRRSHSKWIMSKFHNDHSPELKERCKSFISRMGRHHHNQHHRLSSADLSYDPHSYSLNFDDEEVVDSEEFPMKNFVQRLPASPPRRTLSLSSDDKINVESPMTRDKVVEEVKRNLEIPFEEEQEQQWQTK